MRLYHATLIALGLLVGNCRADSAAARAVVEAAIVAHGGEAALAKWPAVAVHSLGTFHGFERTPMFTYSADTTTCGPDRFHAVLTGKLNGEEFRVANVLDGEHGWITMAGAGKEITQDFTAAQLREAQEKAHLSHLATLLPLRDAAFTLTLAGEEGLAAGEKLAGEAETGGTAVRVRVACAGHGNVTLSFDRMTGLLVKTETRATAGTQVEGKVETLLRRHRDVHGVRRPMAMFTLHDGRPLLTSWVMEYRPAETPDAGAFDVP